MLEKRLRVVLEKRLRVVQKYQDKVIGEDCQQFLREGIQGGE